MAGIFDEDVRGFYVAMDVRDRFHLIFLSAIAFVEDLSEFLVRAKDRPNQSLELKIAKLPQIFVNRLQ